MCPLPADPDSRRRLLEAQRAEADALKTVELTARARDRAQKKLDAAQAELDTAKAGLVDCSGISRAALLLAEDEAELRRVWRNRSRPAGATAQDPTPATGMQNP